MAISRIACSGANKVSKKFELNVKKMHKKREMKVLSLVLNHGQSEAFPCFIQGKVNSGAAMERVEIPVEDFSASINNSRDVLAMIAEVSKKRQSTTEILLMFNIQIGAAVNAQIVGKFHLRQMEPLRVFLKHSPRNLLSSQKHGLSFVIFMGIKPHFH